MPDTPFKSMTRDSSSRKLYEMDVVLQKVTCERCGGYVMAGDWPFCTGKVLDHLR